MVPARALLLSKPFEESLQAVLSCAKQKDVHRANKVDSKKLHHERLHRIVNGQASVRTKVSGSVSTGTSTVQRDQVIDGILAVADMGPSLVYCTCAFSAGKSLEYFNHLHHRHNLVLAMAAASRISTTTTTTVRRAVSALSAVILHFSPRRWRRRSRLALVCFFITIIILIPVNMRQ